MTRVRVTHPQLKVKVKVKMIYSQKENNLQKKIRSNRAEIYATRCFLFLFFLYRCHREGSTIGNLKNTVHVTWRAIRGEALVVDSRENSWPNLRIVYFCLEHYADDPLGAQIRDIWYPRGGRKREEVEGRATFGTRASSARLNRGPNIYGSLSPPTPSRIYYRRRNAISRAKESRGSSFTYLCHRGLIHGPSLLLASPCLF